jgi:hypothetical protein
MRRKREALIARGGKEVRIVVKDDGNPEDAVVPWRHVGNKSGIIIIGVAVLSHNTPCDDSSGEREPNACASHPEVCTDACARRVGGDGEDVVDWRLRSHGLRSVRVEILEKSDLVGLGTGPCVSVRVLLLVHDTRSLMFRGGGAGRVERCESCSAVRRDTKIEQSITDANAFLHPVVDGGTELSRGGTHGGSPRLSREFLVVSGSIGWLARLRTREREGGEEIAPCRRVLETDDAFLVNKRNGYYRRRAVMRIRGVQSGGRSALLRERESQLKNAHLG